MHLADLLLGRELDSEVAEDGHQLLTIGFELLARTHTSLTRRFSSGPETRWSSSPGGSGQIPIYPRNYPEASCARRSLRRACGGMSGPDYDDVGDAPEEEGPPPSDDEIAVRAYRIFLSPDRGSADDNWRRAEAELRLGPALRRSARPRISPSD